MKSAPHARPNDQATDTPRRICVVGAGTRFLSGISYYTQVLANELSRSYDVSVILMRQLLPTRLYPGRARVGVELVRPTYAPGMRVFDGVDWYWMPSLVRALAFLVRERPEVVVLQWWTGTVLHSYTALAAMARLLGMRVVIEFHEVLDPAEASQPLVQRYVRAISPALLHLTAGFVVHSEYDRGILEEHYKLGERPVALIPHGPYNQYVGTATGAAQGYAGATASVTQGEEHAAVCRLLFFGTIRPFKGLEDLLTAFDALSPAEAARYRLTVVGETWEGWTLPEELIARSPHRARITFINRYVHDDEVGDFFAAADVVVLPYHRSSASGPLQIAMSTGLPVIVTAVGGLREAVSGYAGAITIPPKDPEALRAALPRAAALRGQRFADPHSWTRTVQRYDALFAQLGRRKQAIEGQSA